MHPVKSQIIARRRGGRCVRRNFKAGNWIIEVMMENDLAGTTYITLRRAGQTDTVARASGNSVLQAARLIRADFAEIAAKQFAGLT